MITLNMIGGGFTHDICSSAHNIPKYVVWDKTHHDGDISVHIDDAVFTIPPNKNKLNIAWFCESPYFMRPYTSKFDIPEVKEQLLKNYKFIFTSDKELVKKHPEIKYTHTHACAWVKNRQIFPKTKWASIIASAKRESIGHKIRHWIVDQYKDHLDIYGGGYNPILEKGIGLNDYFYSFAIENIKVDGYFTEKISDCFATGTIPIYWGDETLSDYFVEKGIIRLIDEFDPSILTKELYESKMNIIKENFERVSNLPCAEDYIYLNYIK